MKNKIAGAMRTKMFKYSHAAPREARRDDVLDEGPVPPKGPTPDNGRDVNAATPRKLTAALLYLIMMILSPGLCLALDHVVISEVLYDPIATETGGEAVEIYNPTASAIDIGGYAIKTESSASDATIPAGTMLAAHTFYLIADAGWSSLKDNSSWANADHEEAVTLANADAGVAILQPNGTVVDAVGWGNPSGIGAGLYEGTPAAHVTPGKSLKRTDLNADTDNNVADFAESSPELQNSSTTTGGEEETGTGQSITVSVSVENNAPTVNSVTIAGDEDNTTAGVQIIPVPDGTKTVTIVAEAEDSDGTADLQTVTATITGIAGTKTVTMAKTSDISNTTATYEGEIGMEFYEDAGIYNITVSARDNSAENNVTAQFEYLRMLAISIDASALQFSGARIGGTAEINGDYALSTTDSPTIKNTGNAKINIGLYGTDLTDSGKNISITNVKYSFDDDFAGALAGTLAKTLQAKEIGLENSEDSVISLGFQLFIPQTTQNGNYTGSVTIVAMAG
ncbi:lamin tail domain-containing protein [archaeon]|nr:lamin tail domain-containing protein [archaeon]